MQAIPAFLREGERRSHGSSSIAIDVSARDDGLELRDFLQYESIFMLTRSYVPSDGMNRAGNA